jgi:hypothetical protein
VVVQETFLASGVHGPWMVGLPTGLPSELRNARSRPGFLDTWSPRPLF